MGACCGLDEYCGAAVENRGAGAMGRCAGAPPWYCESIILIISDFFHGSGSKKGIGRPINELQN